MNKTSLRIDFEMPYQYRLASQICPLQTRRTMEVQLLRAFEIPEMHGGSTTESKESKRNNFPNFMFWLKSSESSEMPQQVMNQTWYYKERFALTTTLEGQAHESVILNARMARRDTRGRGATPQIPQNGKEKNRDESNRPVINVIFGGEALREQAFVGADVQPYSDCRERPSSAPLPPTTHLRNSTPAAPERVSIIVGMACIRVKGERVIPKYPKPVMGGEIIIGSLDVRGRGDCLEVLFVIRLHCEVRRCGAGCLAVRRAVCRRGCVGTVRGVAVRLRQGGAGAVRRGVASAMAGRRGRAESDGSVAVDCDA
nr:hypothetical protein Iba_chr08eCG5920 [Ipomoea batatas]